MSFTNINSYNSISVPLQIPGCTLWLDSGDASTVLRSNTSNVYQWNDKSGRGVHVSAVGTSNPTYTDTVSGINFASNQFLVNTNASLSYQKHTLFFVCNQTVAGPRNNFSSRVITFVTPGGGFDFSSGGIVYGCIFGQSLNNYGLAGFYDTGFGTPNGQLVPKGIYSETYNQTSNRIISTYRNGSNIANAGPVNSGYNMPSTYSTLIIGAGVFGANTYIGFWIGNVYEVIVYSNVLNTTQRRYIEGYLASKWSLNSSLIATNPFKTTAPNNYYNFAIDFVSVPQTQYQAFSNVPSQIGGLALWLDAADSSTVLLSGSNVTQWNDKSGNGRNGTANGTVVYASRAIGGLNTISYIGVTNSYIRGNLSITGTTFTAFALMTLGTNSLTETRMISLGAVGSFDNNNVSYSVAIARNGGSNALYTARANNGSPANPITYNTPLVACSLYDGTNKTIFVNSAGLSNSSSGTFNTSVYQIGSGLGRETGDYYTGFIGEIIIYTTALTTTQRQQVEGYLAWKWGINTTLPSTHPYYTGAYNNIFPGLQVALPSVGLTTSFLTQGFSPLSIPGLRLWLDASDSSTLILNGASNISQWRDKSGCNYIMFQPVTSNQPFLLQGGLNSLNTVRFVSANFTSMNISNTFAVNGMSNISIFFVASAQTTVGTGYQNCILWWPETGGWGQLGVSLGTNGIYWRFGTGQANIYPGSAVSIGANNFVIGSLSKQSLVETPFINGTQGTIFNASNPAIANTGTTTYVGQGGNTTYANNVVGEILFYNTLLTNQQRQQVEGYLAWKWGLTNRLPSGHQNQYMPP